MAVVDSFNSSSDHFFSYKKFQRHLYVKFKIFFDRRQQWAPSTLSKKQKELREPRMTVLQMTRDSKRFYLCRKGLSGRSKENTRMSTINNVRTKLEIREEKTWQKIQRKRRRQFLSSELLHRPQRAVVHTCPSCEHAAFLFSESSWSRSIMHPFLQPLKICSPIWAGLLKSYERASMHGVTKTKWRLGAQPLPAEHLATRYRTSSRFTPQALNSSLHAPCSLAAP